MTFQNVKLKQIEELNVVLNAFKPKNTQMTFTCSMSTMKTQEKSVTFFKVKNKDTSITQLTSFWCFYY